jgi:putative ABC transport system substrate-binding protein
MIMRRREFIALVAAAVWPLAVRGQQRVRLVGMVSGFSDAEMRRPLLAFREKLTELGWTEGADVRIDARHAHGDYKRLGEDARTLVDLPADVIVAMGTPGLTAVRQHTRSVPVVFTLVIDPVAQGLVNSLARPGGHATGFTNFEFPIGGKWLELLREMDPRIRRIILLGNAGNPIAVPLSQFIEGAGRSVALDVTSAFVRNAAHIEAAIGSIAQQPAGAVIVLPDSLAVVHSKLIIALASRYRLPTLYPFRLFPENGGLMSYGLDVPELYRQVAVYVDRILKGEKPADLPVQAPNKFELLINAKTAKALGITVPATILARADEVIE